MQRFLIIDQQWNCEIGFRKIASNPTCNINSSIFYVFLHWIVRTSSLYMHISATESSDHSCTLYMSRKPTLYNKNAEEYNLYKNTEEYNLKDKWMGGITSKWMMGLQRIGSLMNVFCIKLQVPPANFNPSTNCSIASRMSYDSEHKIHK